MKLHTTEVPDLSSVQQQLPEGEEIVGCFKNGANHVLLSTKRGLEACLKKKDGTLGGRVKVANSREFVNARKSRYTDFLCCLKSEPGNKEKGLDLVFKSDMELSRSGIVLVCSGSSRVNVVNSL